MSIYKAPNLIISPKRKVYRRGRGGQSTINPSTHTHTLPPYTHTSITVSGREGYWDGEKCVFRADLKANVELE